MDIVTGALLFLLFLLVYPIIVSSIKMGNVGYEARETLSRVGALESALAKLRERVALLEQSAPAPAPEPAVDIIFTLDQVMAPPPPPVTEQPAPEPVPEVQDVADASDVDTTRAEEPALPLAARYPVFSDEPAVTPAWLLAVKQWLFTGNLVAKFGLLILLIGIGFLITYTAQYVTVPIELRLAGVVMADIGLLLWGWRIRTRRRDVALPVQGAAVAILMVVVFAAFQRLHLIPLALAFPLLVLLTVFTCVLALLQDAFWLAVFGIIGGFAAPLLVATGSGNHIALFSYYALLNTGILVLALKRKWRALNLLGFWSTFVIGTAWGVTHYSPENYASSQLFLILFFLFYVGIALAWARKGASRFNDAVDATLVFGTPAAAFALQYGLVRHIDFAMAFTSLALGLFYITLAMLLRRAGTERGLLVAAFIALATIFGTMAIPFALSGTWTSAAWALEGTGLIWIGLRQKQQLVWTFGLLVQGGAWIAFLQAHAALLGRPGQGDLTALLLGTALLAVAAVMSSWLLRSDDLGKRTISHVLLGVASAWWFFGVLWWAAASLAQLHSDIVFDLGNATRGSLQVAIYIVLASASALTAQVVAHRQAWTALHWLAPSGWVILSAASFTLLEDLYTPPAWPTVPQTVAWAVAWVSGDILLRRWQALQWPMATVWRYYLHLLRIGVPWLMLWPLLSRLLADWLAVDAAQQDLLTMTGWRVSGSWSHFIPTWVMIVGIFWLAARSRTDGWPTAPIGRWYRHRVIPAAACWFMLLALFWNLQQDGTMAPLPYLPVLNPLDLTTAFTLLLWLACHRLWQHGEPADAAPPSWLALIPRMTAFAAWGWLNMILLRTAAHYLTIDYRLDALALSTFIQAMLSLAWSVSALVLMRRAGRDGNRNPRQPWMLGAVLLGIVVAKLFLVDLANTGTIARIVSFVGVGLLMVVIGYLAPYPAKASGASTPQPAGSEA